MKKFSLFLLPCLALMLAVMLVACGPDTPPDEVQLPSNLTTNTVVTEGLAEVTATANDANYYTFTFYEGTDSTSFEEQDGVAEYTFAAAGTYNVRVRAHATATAFIEVVEQITINIDAPWTGGIPTTGYSTPNSYAGYTLVWSDEFDGTSLSSDWVHETGNGNWGWGNNEKQFYLERNTEVSDGLLKITAKQETQGGYAYTSSRMKTAGQQIFQYGRIDIRAALPYGQGIWPALWMLGNSFSNVGWPACGEIDIMEMVGGAGNRNATVHGTAHWQNNGNHAEYSGSKTLSEGILAEEFHVYSIVWDNNSIRWLLDDQQYHVLTISSADLSAFQGHFYFIFNVAVGGIWPGNPDATTVFPQTMAVDYVRVFQQ